MVEIKDLKKVLKDTNKIVKHQQELMVAKGEHFNLFSVLNIETKENKTHSAFLAELLNPNGSHQQGAVFLDLFLEVVTPQIQHENEEEHKNKFPTKSFDLSKVFIKSEYTIGAINLCDKEGEDNANASGGRIDILLQDKNDNIISIENKIHAIDQDKQIQRYCNYKTANNTVFYLTLKGDEPCDKSKLKLVSGIHFHNISYRDHIVQWLALCLKEVPNFTALREAINQYILLIKKLTHTLDNNLKKQLNTLMMSNYAEAAYISSNFESLSNWIKDSMRDKIIELTSLKLTEEALDLKVDNGSRITNKFAQVWIKKGANRFFYGVESFSGNGHHSGNLFIGIFVMESHKLSNNNDFNYGWNKTEFILDEFGEKINFSTPKLVSKLYLDHEFKLALACRISKQIIKYINSHPIY